MSHNSKNPDWDIKDEIDQEILAAILNITVEELVIRIKERNKNANPK